MFRKLYNEELGRIGVEEYKNSAKAPVAVVLDNVRSGHNVGSAFRTCDAFRISKIFLCGICAVPPSPEIHKTALGAEFSVDWEHCDSTVEVARRLKAEGWTLVGVEQTENSTMLQDFTIEKGRRYAFIFGNEVNGVAQEVMDLCDMALEIPQQGTKHSLNVSVSVGIVLWDIIRRII
ncbi:MAG: RNA methyltransferase [Bacteroidales bacterium]|nr:RNA methyltransferase [Bacteroidales bacterium]